MPVAKFFAAMVGAVVVLLVAGSMLTRPRFGSRTMAYFGSMKSDLRNLVTAQEDYFTDSVRYAPSLEALGAQRYAPSQGVTVTVTRANDRGWAATARHSTLREDQSCTIEIGFADSLGTEPEGEPVCPALQQRRWKFVWER